MIKEYAPEPSKQYKFNIPEKGKKNGRIGENVSLWRKPNTNEVSAFEGNSTGGQGWIGAITDEFLAHHIGLKGKYDAVLAYKDNEHAYIDVTLYNIDQEKLNKINKKQESGQLGCFIAIIVVIILIAGYCAS